MKASVRAVAFFLLAGACLGCARADDAIAPRPDCIASDLAQEIDFDDRTGLPLYLSEWNFWNFVRTGRECRFHVITLTLYADEAGRRVAKSRARMLARMLTRRHWPSDAITTRFQSLERAPSGVDAHGSWRAKAQISYAEPDPNWHPRLRQPTQSCSFDSNSNISHCTSIPWTPRLASRIPPPPPPWDPRVVIFDRDKAALRDQAQEIVAEGLRIFQDMNFRKFVLFGQRSLDEPVNLAIRRAATVRDALVRLGVKPHDIKLRIEKTPAEAPPAGEEYFYRRVTIDYED